MKALCDLLCTDRLVCAVITHMNTNILAYVVYTVSAERVSRIQMKEVVRIAIMVPIGMDLCASLRSPDLLEPAIIPKIKYTQTHTHTQCKS